MKLVREILIVALLALQGMVELTAGARGPVVVGTLAEGVEDTMEVGEVDILEVEEAPVTVMVSYAPCHPIPLPQLMVMDLLLLSTH